MIKCEIEITLLEPLAIASQKGVGNVMPTLEYIPGSTLRGALAQLWLEQNGQQEANGKLSVPPHNSEFERLFLSEDVVYGNATPGQFHSRVLPQTAVTCKNSKGFGGHDGVRNTLFRDAQFALSGQFDRQELLCRYNPDGTDPLEPFEGYFSNNSISPLTKRFITRTRISDTFHTAEHGSLYTREALESGQVFTGVVVLKDVADQAILTNLLNGVNNTLYLGAARSRGTGRVKVDLRPHCQRWSTNIQKRFDRLQDKLATRCAGCYWTLTTLSDTILTDEYFRSKTWIDIKDIADSLEELCRKNGSTDIEIRAVTQTVQSFELVRGWSKSKLVVGWHSAWGLPKFDDTAIAAGSVFLFYRKNPASVGSEILAKVGKTEEQLLLEAMSLLELCGIGERRNEGFGQVAFCDDFNIEEGHHGK